MSGLKELDSVRVTHFSADQQRHLVWEYSARAPKVGDIGTIIEIRPKGIFSTQYGVECVGTSGETLWIAHFDSAELELNR